MLSWTQSRRRRTSGCLKCAPSLGLNCQITRVDTALFACKSSGARGVRVNGLHLHYSSPGLAEHFGHNQLSDDGSSSLSVTLSLAPIRR